MILSIPEAGYSGQKFLERSYDLISKINEIQKKKKINLFVDGGINREKHKEHECRKHNIRFRCFEQ